MADRWTEREMLTLAAQGLGKVDHLGNRGITQVTSDEIAAMAGTLAAFGLVPIVPGKPLPEKLFVTKESAE